MIIGAVSENKNSEKRISITPDIAKKYLDNGFNVVIESDLASHLGISDEDFRKVGCQVDNRENVLKKSNIVLQVNLPDDDSLNLVKENDILIGNFNSTKNKTKIENISKKNVSVFSMELLPRITRAQSMDILSSQANLAGYKAVVDSFALFKESNTHDDDCSRNNISSKSFNCWSWCCRTSSDCNCKKNGSNRFRN